MCPRYSPLIRMPDNTVEKGCLSSLLYTESIGKLKEIYCPIVGKMLERGWIYNLGSFPLKTRIKVNPLNRFLIWYITYNSLDFPATSIWNTFISVDVATLSHSIARIL